MQVTKELQLERILREMHKKHEKKRLEAEQKRDNKGRVGKQKRKIKTRLQDIALIK